MNERDSFLKTIAADPADDTVRLVFADWLDEHGEPERAEFIRLQVKRARSGNKSKDDGLPPREQMFLNGHAAQWLGPLADFKRREGFEYTFRRGFIDAVTIYGRHLAEHVGALREYCPALTELDVIGVRGFGAQIANALPHGVRTLRLEDWPFPADAEALAKSPHLAHLESLSFWLGSENDQAVCEIIGESRDLPVLRRVELVQVAGGIDAFEQAAELDVQADRKARVLNTRRGSEIASIYRPFAELLPLATEVGRYLHGGTVPDGRLALLFSRVNSGQGSCIVYYFDPAGHLLSGERIDLSGTMHRIPRYGGYDRDELFERMGERIGWKPGLIRVREFDTEAVVPGTATRVYKFDGTAYQFIDFADAEHDSTYGSREEQLERVRYWLRDGNFCITHGGDAAWAGPDGTIHST